MLNAAFMLLLTLFVICSIALSIVFLKRTSGERMSFTKVAAIIIIIAGLIMIITWIIDGFGI